MGEVPIEFALFSACSQQFVLVKLPEVGFYKIMGEAPIFRPSVFFFWNAHFLQKKIMGGAPMMRPSVFFFAAHDPYIPTWEAFLWKIEKRRARVRKHAKYLIFE